MKMFKKTIFLIFLCIIGYQGYSQKVESGIERTKVYPNPLIGGQKFIVKSESVISMVEVVNVIGKVVNRTENERFGLQEIQVYVGNCEKGMYFVKITFQDKSSIIKKLLVK